MAWQEVTYKLTGSAPLLMHNGQTADPLNKFAKAMKQISSKRAKTDADYEEMARIEFNAGLYVNGNGPCLPAHVLTATIVGAAKKQRQGKLAQSGILIPKHVDLDYDGPRDVEAMWQDERFRHSAIVRVQSARVSRTRPVFEDWSATVTVQYEDTLINRRQLDDWLFIAGTQVGIGDWRPQYGRFEVDLVE